MRTTVDLEKRLIDEVVELTGEKSLSKALSKAIEDYIRRKRTAELIANGGRRRAQEVDPYRRIDNYHFACSSAFRSNSSSSSKLSTKSILPAMAISSAVLLRRI